MFKNKPLIPITPEVSVDSYLISSLSAMAFPKLNEYIEVMDKLVDEASDEVYSSELSMAENEKRIEIRYFQKLWKAILEKGRDNNV